MPGERTLEEGKRFVGQSDRRVDLADDPHQPSLYLGLVGQLTLNTLCAAVEQFASRDRCTTRDRGIRHLEDALQELRDGFGLGRFRTRHVAFLGELREVETGERDNKQEGRDAGAHAGAVPPDELAEPVAHGVRPREDGTAVQVPDDVLVQCLDRRVASLRLLPQRLEADHIEVAAQLFAQPPRVAHARARAHGRGLAHNALDLGEGLALEVVWPRAREKLVEDHAERVDIGCRADLLTAHLLGRGIPRRHHTHRGAGECGAIALIGEHFGNAKVEQAHLAPLRDEDVVWFEVSVHHETRVREAHRTTNLGEEPQAVVDGETVRGAVAINRIAFHQLHRKPRGAVGGESAVYQPRNLRMVERGEDLPLALEALQDLLGVHPAADELECDLLREGAVHPFGEVDGAHAAVAEFANNAPGANALALGGRGVGGGVRSGAGGIAHGVAESFGGAFVGADEAGDFLVQRWVVGALASEVCIARVGREGAGGVEECAHASPARRVVGRRRPGVAVRRTRSVRRHVSVGGDEFAM